MSVQQELNRDLRDVMRKNSILKDAGGSIGIGDDVTYGGLIPEPEVVGLLNLTRNHSAWLSAINMTTRQRRTGRIKYRYQDGYVLEYVGEDDLERQVTSRPSTGYVEYTCKRYKAGLTFDYDDLAEYRAAGEANFEASVLQDFYTQLGNNLADLTFNADSSLADTTRAHRALRGQDGADILTDAATVVDANGLPFKPDVFIAMRDQLPFGWRNNPENRYWFNDRVQDAWQHAVSSRATSLGDFALMNEKARAEWMQKALINPYIRDDQGPDAIAPTSVTDNTTYLTVNLGTLVTAGDPASVDAGVGRLFMVTCKATGVSQVLRGKKSGTDLVVDTTNLLGQTTASTTASDYEVRPADETSLYYGPPKNVNLVMCREMRSYREYNKDSDRIEIVIWIRLAVVVPEPILPGIVKVTNVALPPIDVQSVLAA